MNYHNVPTDYSAYRPAGYPVRHKEKVPFDPKLRMNPKYREIMRKIRDLDNSLGEMVLSCDDYLDLVNDAYSSNIHWSVKIEGNELPLEEVFRLTTLFTSKQYKEGSPGGPKQEILNHLYSYLMKPDFQLPWSLFTMKDVHSLLLGKTGANCPIGEFRTEPGNVVGPPDNFEYFITCPPGSIEKEMNSLLEWLAASPYDEIITAALFFHEFESIHPFQDGNGRTGRTLFQILLQELGLKNSKLCKFEQKLLDPKETYYTLLAYTDATGDYGPFIMYVAESLLSAYEEAFAAFEKKDLIKNMDESSKTIIKRAKKQSRFTISDACRWVPGLGEQSIRNKLYDLIDIGLLEKVGKTRSTLFMFRDPFRDFVESRGSDDQ
ncbi:MAG: Fic family protein [Candidatus Methanoplasma sp.]|jgi:Fic family protein|nr:Fic family protein [Candidatus Methanoplasma sp.]